MAITGGGRGIQIVVGAEYKDKDLKRAQRDLDRLRKQTQKSVGPMQRLGNTIRRNLGKAMAGAAIAAGALAVKLGTEGIKMAIENEKTVANLANTLKQLGMAHEQTGIEDFVAQMEFATGIADEKLRPAMALLLGVTRDADEAQRRLGQAMDLAAFTGQDLDAIVRALARSLGTGSAGTLSRYGVLIDDNTVKTEGFSTALDEALAPSVGAMDAQVNTLGGQMQRLQQQTDNLLEAFGFGFINGFARSKSAVDDTADSLVELQPILEDLGRQIGEFVETIADWSPVLLPIFKGLTDLTGPLYDNIVAVNDVVRNGRDPVEAFADAYGYATDKVTDFNNVTSGNNFGGGDFQTQMGDFATSFTEVNEEIEETIDSLMFFQGLLDERAAVRNYERALDELRDSIKENGKNFDETTKKGRENQDALDDIFKSATQVADSQQTVAGKAEVMRDAMRQANDVLDRMGLSDAKRRQLLQPFVDAQVELDKTYMGANDVRRALVDIPNDIDINVQIKINEVWGSRVQGGDGYNWRDQATDAGMPSPSTSTFTLPTGPNFRNSVRSQPLVMGMGTPDFSDVPGPSRIQASGESSGIVVHQLNVTSAPGEKAEESVPRALRKLAFVAGL